ncbi:uncharacterized protein LOC107025379 [Solanum pennellii]|uniref:Uncharacterized protein LOC107025379 n=1 Tax=Solanum pennellii TaxID=28526 RepID=A0ABM1H7T3_SOLPN|nr:uncharacterized protein LOC107025379 [Solanum pennellii]
MEDDEFTIPNSPPSLKQKLKNSLCFSCCFTHRNTTTKLHALDYHPPPSRQPSSSDENPSLIWIKPDIKDKCRTIFNFISNGNGNRHKRHSSAEFRYDPLSYSLNFEDDAPLTNFSSRLPPSPSPPQPPVKNLGIAAAVYE